MKSILIPIVFLAAPFLATSQINYHQSPGKITISANSVLLPNTTVTASAVSSDNPGSVPTPYNNAFSDQINHLFQYVDRTAVTTGLLKDYGIDFTDVERCNGQLATNN